MCTRAWMLLVIGRKGLTWCNNYLSSFVHDIINECCLMSGLFSRGVYSTKFEIAAFTELNFAKIMENHTHVPSIATLQVQSLRK